MTETLDYEKVYREFSWDKCMHEYLDWPKNGYFNITHEAIDRHAGDPKKVAIFYISADGGEEMTTSSPVPVIESVRLRWRRRL